MDALPVGGGDRANRPHPLHGDVLYQLIRATFVKFDIGECEFDARPHTTHISPRIAHLLMQFWIPTVTELVIFGC